VPDPADREARRWRRAALRRAHPDLGGDPEEFIRVERSLSQLGPSPVDDVRFVRRPGGLARVLNWLGGRLRRRRHRPPARVL
jgi:hypothetical protein